MIRTYLILLSFALWAAQPVFATQADKALAKTSASPVTVEDHAERTTEDALERLEQELQNARYERDVANIHADLIDRQTSWFEILISVLLGGFSLVVSGVVVFFTFRFGKAAVHEAKQAIAKEIEEISTLLTQAKEAVSEIHADRDKAHELLASISPSDIPKDQATRDSLRELAASAKRKPRAGRSADDFRALINVAAIDEDWAAVERRAAAMSYLFEDDDEANAFALFAKGYAFGQLGRSKDEIAIYEDILVRFGQSSSPALLEQVAKALVNKGVRLRQLEKPEEAVAAYDDLLARFDKNPHSVLEQYVAKALVNRGVAQLQLERIEDAFATYDDVLVRFSQSLVPELQEQVANALVNKGSALVAVDRFEEATAVLDEVLIRFGKSQMKTLQDRVGSAMFNKACCYGKWGRVEPCVEALVEWRGHGGKLDCDKIAGDTDFDSVRANPQFLAFLADNGCVPPSKPPRQKRPRKPAKE